MFVDTVRDPRQRLVLLRPGVESHRAFESLVIGEGQPGINQRGFIALRGRGIGGDKLCLLACGPGQLNSSDNDILCGLGRDGRQRKILVMRPRPQVMECPALYRLGECAAMQAKPLEEK